MKRNRFWAGVCAVAFLAWAALPLGPVHAQQKTVKVGMLLAMTGAGAFYGQVMSRGAQLAVDQINRAGGVGGFKLELVIEDH